METGAENTTEVTQQPEPPKVRVVADRMDNLPSMRYAWKAHSSYPNMMTFDRSVDPDWSGIDPVTNVLEASEYVVRALADTDNYYFPKTVGGLYRQWVEQYLDNRRILNALTQVNIRMNEYADSAGLCSQYDEAVENLNNVLAEFAPGWTFQFEGRSRQYRVVVNRQRTVEETAVIYVDGPANADSDYITEEVFNHIDGLAVDDWEIMDDEYNIDQPEVVEWDTAV